MKIYHKCILLICIFFHVKYVSAQNEDITIQNILTKYQFKDKYYTNILNNVYQKIGYQLIWFNNNNTIDIIKEINLQSDVLGLNKEDYKVAVYNENKMRSFNTKLDSINAEINFTYTLIIFMHHYNFGNTVPKFGYNGLNININAAILITNKLIDLIKNNKLVFSNLLLYKNSLPEVYALENMIKELVVLNTNKPNGNYHINSSKISYKNAPLINKLSQLGILDTLKENVSDSILKQKISLAQNLFNLQEEPKISDRLKAELNIDILERIKRLKVSLNYYKWLYWKLINSNEPVILVNIPNAYMKVYNKNNIILEMKMVLGKYSTKTPTLTSRVNNVVLYPYWHVPYSIATKELLPKIKRNISYLNSGNYQVINSSGKIINPYTINWQALGKNYFPYTIRQSTGCDNSLGLIKLDFENPFGVYLHDTPSKLYFEQNKRFYSHGCMRMEKPTEIGKIILGSNHLAIDTLIEKGCLLNKSPIWVNAEIKSPLIVWYNLAGIDKFGKVVFYENIYKMKINENK